jgi:hypothetical protein
MSQLGAILRGNVAAKMFSGIRTSGNINALAMQGRRVAGAFRQVITTSDNNLTFRCNLNVCGDTSVCGP